MNGVRSIQRLNQRELEEGITPEGSWHTDYRDTAFIFYGGLPFELSEGDIITIFSQYGEPVWIKLARDKETGKSRGFGWLKYEDQRSCDLAVDNLGGATVMDRVLKVDHARYKPRDDEDMRDNTMGEPAPEDAADRRKRRRTDSPSESDSDDDRPMLPEEVELEKAVRTLDEEDPMKESLVRSLREKADTAVQKYKRAKRKEKESARKHERRHRHRSGDRPRIKDRSDSEDGDKSRSSRRQHRDRDEAEDGDHRSSRRHRHDRDRRDRSRERRRHSDDDGDEYKHSRSRHSPRPKHRDSHRDDVDDRDRRKPSGRESCS